MPASSAVAASLDRRSFLKLSAGSAALLSTGALTASLAGCASDTPPASGYAWLTPLDVDLLTALAPAVLGPMLSKDSAAAQIAGVVKGIDGAVMHLYAPSQKALRQLFDLLNTGLTRRLAAGVSSPWNAVTPEQAQVFMARWRSSSIGLFNAGYRGLSKLLVATWFSTDAGLAAAGYPGPWKPMFDAVNAPAADAAPTTAAAGA